jgi:hypothetical protein
VTALYREQYDRMKRWYDRFVVIDQGRPHDVPTDNYLDEVCAFFMNCYHLKDWIKHDGTVAENVRRSVELHIDSSRPLKLCADICNSLKHLRLRPGRSGESPDFGKKQIGLALGAGPPAVDFKYEIDTATGPIDAFQLATDCVRAWEVFMTTNGLR